MHIEVASEQLFSFLGIPITNTMLTEWLVILIFLIVGLSLSKKITLLSKNKIQDLLEIIVDFLYSLVNTLFPGEKIKEGVFFFSSALFLLIMSSNLLGLFPGVGSIGYYEGEKFIPFLRSPNSDLNMTLSLALLSVIVAQYYGIKKSGFLGYAKRFFRFNNFIEFFLGFIELISELAKVISFSFRLFGNIFAGEVLLITIAFLIPIIAPLPFMFLEVFVGIIQAFVFALLTMVFIKTAVLESHH